MSRINLVGTQHHEPRVKERTAEVIQNNDFDSLFVEGVSPDDADTVEEAVNKWVRQVSESTGMNVPEDTGENSRFEEAVVAEENFNGDINYLDSTESGFLNVRDNVKDDLIRASKGEISSPRILSDPDVTQEQFQGIMHMFTPDPDLPYHIFIGDMDEDEYREHLAESAVEMYRERFPAGADPSEEQEPSYTTTFWRKHLLKKSYVRCSQTGFTVMKLSRTEKSTGWTYLNKTTMEKIQPCSLE